MPRKELDEITYLFQNFSGTTVEVWEWISDFMPHFIMDVVTYPKGAPVNMVTFTCRVKTRL